MNSTVVALVYKAASVGMEAGLRRLTTMPEKLIA